MGWTRWVGKYHCSLNMCYVNKESAESKCIIVLFKHSTPVEKFEYDETVDKFHSHGQVTICVCSGHVSVIDKMYAMSVTSCVTC